MSLTWDSTAVTWDSSYVTFDGADVEPVVPTVSGGGGSISHSIPAWRYVSVNRETPIEDVTGNIESGQGQSVDAAGRMTPPTISGTISTASAQSVAIAAVHDNWEQRLRNAYRARLLTTIFRRAA